MGHDGGQREREVALLRRQVETFRRANAFLTSMGNRDELLTLIMQEARTVARAQASCIALGDRGDGLLHIRFASGENGEPVRHLTVAEGQGILGQVAATDATLRVDQVGREAGFDASVDCQTGITTRCILATPLRPAEEPRGVLAVINKRQGRRFTQGDARLLELVAHQAAIAMDGSRRLQRMVQGERLSLVGGMAAAIVHDLKSPLAAVRGLAELLGSQELAARRRQTLSDLILKEIDRLVAMTQELLDYSRGAMRCEPVEVRLEEWIGQIVPLLEEELSASRVKLAVHLEFPGAVWLDPQRMRRVVMNLAANARDAMPDGGTFTIATRRGGDHWELLLTDTGQGIPPDLRCRAFEPFFTAGKERGTGLGLAICRETVQGHGGTIEVRSRVAGEEAGEVPGTTFRIRMPLAPPGEGPPPTPTPSARCGGRCASGPAAGHW